MVMVEAMKNTLKMKMDIAKETATLYFTPTCQYQLNSISRG